MAPVIVTAAHAARLSMSPKGVTATVLAAVAKCPLRSAQRCLAALAGAGVLRVEVPSRKGQVGSKQKIYFIVEMGR